MEMHLVHFKSSFATIADSLADPQSDTLAVLGIFFQVSFKLRKILAKHFCKQYRLEANKHIVEHAFGLKDAKYISLIVSTNLQKCFYIDYAWKPSRIRYLGMHMK